jgi:hypothetical protein
VLCFARITAAKNSRRWNNRQSTMLQIVLWDFRIMSSSHTKSEPAECLKCASHIESVRRCWHILHIKGYTSRQSDAFWSQKIWPIVRSKISKSNRYFRYLDVILRIEHDFTWDFRISVHFHRHISFYDSYRIVNLYDSHRDDSMIYLPWRIEASWWSDNESLTFEHYRLWHTIYNYCLLYEISCEKIRAHTISVRLSLTIWETWRVWSVRRDLILVW